MYVSPTNTGDFELVTRRIWASVVAGGDERGDLTSNKGFNNLCESLEVDNIGLESEDMSLVSGKVEEEIMKTCTGSVHEEHDDLTAAYGGEFESVAKETSNPVVGIVSASEFGMEIRQGSSGEGVVGVDEETEERKFGTTKSSIDTGERNNHSYQVDRTDGQITTDSDISVEGEEVRFHPAALATFLKAATAGLGSSLRLVRSRPNHTNMFPSLKVAMGGESESNLSEEEKHKLKKLQSLRVKYLRLVHRLGKSVKNSIAEQLALLANSQSFSLDAGKKMAIDQSEELNFSLNKLVLGKSGVGKTVSIDAFGSSTTLVREVSRTVGGVKITIIDTPGLKSYAMDQSANSKMLSTVKKVMKKFPPDIVLYVDRLDDAQKVGLNNLPLLRTITASLGLSIWDNAIVILTNSASAPPDGPSGTPLKYDEFVSECSCIVQHSITQAIGLVYTTPVYLVENHPLCRKNRAGEKLIRLCYSMKVLSDDASRRTSNELPLPLPILLSWLLPSRAHPKFPSDQGGDSDIEVDDVSDSDDEYNQLPPFKQNSTCKTLKEQRKAYFEEYDYCVKLLQKKQWREESTSQFVTRSVLDTQGWDRDCGYNCVIAEHSLVIAKYFLVAVTVQMTKNKKGFNIHLDSSLCAKHGGNGSTMAGLTVRSVSKQLMYVVVGETKLKNLKKNKTTLGGSVTFFGGDIAIGLKLEDQITLGKRIVLVGSAGTMQTREDSAYEANVEANLRSQISVGRQTNVAAFASLDTKRTGRFTVRASSSDQLQIAVMAILPLVVFIYKRVVGSGDN
ncbi:hypothetical protein N665_1328s0009 [Sinapis alba]|nr:hypothetical protein N665_1328s0009 [Sinapis alba]